jgi:hypothetical protein
MLLTAHAVGVLQAVSPASKPLLPPWPPTYDMQSSTILQPSNADGACCSVTPS